jgi:hypothetical protein
MGSFNTTCAISHAPIRPDDKVRLFFLASKGGYYKELERNILSIGCQCYPWDDFEVIGGISLEATYEDYNNYSFKEDDIYSHYIHNIIKRDYSPNIRVEGEEYNESHDHMDVKVENLDWEKIMNMIHSGRLYLKGYGRGAKPAVAMMAIHESVYQIMMNETYEKYVNETSDYRNATYVTIGFKDLLLKNLEKEALSNLDSDWERFLKHFQKEVDSGKITHEQAVNQAKLFAKMHKSTSRDHHCNYTFQSESPLNGLRELNDNIKEIVSKGGDFAFNPCKDDELIQKYTEGLFFNSRMSTHNFMYRPVMTSGQEHDLTADGMFWSKVSNALITMNTAYESEEHILTRKMSKQWQEIKLSEIHATFKDWFDEEDFEERIMNINNIFVNSSKGSFVTILAKDIKNPEYNELAEVIWNKELDIIIEIDV